jgi:hypothetical protein
MTSSRGLPPGAQPWGRDVEAALARLKEIEEIARRICNDFGLDFSNPARGLSTGATPGVENPVQLKLPSLNDLDIRDAQDGDLLTFDGRRGKWVARRHDTVQLPKPVPVGDPDSYYVPEPDPEPPVAGRVWSEQYVGKNFLTDPSFELAGSNNWEVTSPEMWGDPTSGVVVMDTEFSFISVSQTGSSALHVTATWLDPTGMGSGFSGTLYALTPELPLETTYFGAYMRAVEPTDEIAGMTAGLMVFDAAGQVVNTVPSESLTDTNPYFYARDSVDVWTYRGTNPAWTYTGVPIPEGGSIRGYVHLDNMPPHQERQFYVDTAIASNGQPPTRHLPFNGNTPNGNSILYSWDGAPNASTSTALQLRRIEVPQIITLGEEFTVNGEGYMPDEQAYIYITTANGWGEWQSLSAVAGSDGKFTCTATIPVIDDPDYNPAEVEPTVAFYVWSANTTQPPKITVTFEQ